jgi:sugar phosphate isomerase/epimerase
LSKSASQIELSKGATPILLLLLILLPQSNLESKIKSMIKSKREGISPNSMAVRRRGQSCTFFRHFPSFTAEKVRTDSAPDAEFVICDLRFGLQNGLESVGLCLGRLKLRRKAARGRTGKTETEKTIMTAITRREFMKHVAISSGAAGVLAASVTRVAANPLGLPIGSQVWPMRASLKDFPAFVKRMAGIGVTRLELCSPIGYGAQFASLSDAKEVRQILADQGMKSESSHFTMNELRHSHRKGIEWAKEIGIEQMITASLGDGNGGSHPTLDQIKRAADEYNKIAAVTADAGLQQGLHNEGFELSIVDGVRTYDRLFDMLDPKLVKFQFQMSTITAGFVAADYFTKYPGRFFSMHLQDIDMNDPEHPQVPLGQGSIDWVKTFTAAKAGGVRNYFVEQTWRLTRQSVAYLKSLNV